MRDVFVSHAVADQHLAEALVEFLIDAIGVPSKRIFCSSVPGFGIPLTYNFNDHMRDKIKDAKLVILLMTPSYMGSKFCMMELGAAWTRSLTALPIVVEPVTFSLVTSTIGQIQGWDIADAHGLQTFRETVLRVLDLEGQEQHIFDKKRERWIATLASLLQTISASQNVDRAALDEAVDELEEVRRQLIDARSIISQMESRLAAVDEMLPRVLIIEDEPLIAMDIKQLLENSGFQVVSTARTATEASSAAQECAPNVIVADIQLADGSSGVDAITEISGEKDVAVTFVTSFPERLLVGQRPKSLHLVTKPFDPNHLVDTVKESFQAYVSRRWSAQSADE